MSDTSDTPDPLPNDSPFEPEADPAEESATDPTEPEPQEAIGAVPLPEEPTPAPTGMALFLVAARAYSFPASIVPVLLGTALAARGYGGFGQFDGVTFVLTLLGALLAHSGGNILNDYYDYLKGVDTQPEHGSGVITRGWITPDNARKMGIRLLAAGALCGYLILMRSPEAVGVVIPLALLGLVCAALYTPILKQRALGDLTIMAAFGFGLTLGAYGVQTPLLYGGQVGLIALLSLPLTLLVDAILHANNIRDMENDASRGYSTIASVLGKDGSQNLQALLVFGPLALVVTFVGLHLLPPSCLAVLLAVPLLLKAYRTGDVPLTAQAHLLFGVLYAASVVLMPQP